MLSANKTRLAASLLSACALMALAGATTALAAQESSARETTTPELSPHELVRLTVANEIAADNHPEILHMFRSRKQTPKGSQTRLYVETSDALAAMLVAQNDQPLNAEQQKTETDHLNWLVNTPDQLRKKRAREKDDDERSMRIVKALPDAFLYEYVGTEKSTTGLGEADDPLAKLAFKPNPAYSAPSRVEETLSGMQGFLLIDTKTRRLAQIDGTLFREISFGWGILGHLDQGGHFIVKQADLGLGDGVWGITEIKLNITGKILMVKNLSMISDEVLSDFKKMPDNLTFAQAVEMLKTGQEKLARGTHLDQTTVAQKTPQ
ncbi:MAG: hypothetical protein ABSE44_17425 [Candidatus Sulfotelmatobacter sp.]|jgi:hypothetical protein